MTLYINVKQIGKRKSIVHKIPFEYAKTPQTVRELIVMTVQICVEQYHKRQQKYDSPEPLSKEEIEDQAMVGRIAFGLPYSKKEVDMEKAIDSAIMAFRDALYRIFVEENELEGLDTELALKEEQTLTFIRLTMLAGQVW